MNTVEALRDIAEKLECDAEMYRNMIETGTVVKIEEKVDSGIVEVIIRRKE